MPAAPKGRRRPLTRDRVLAAGVALADAEGPDGLTMRRLGRELGVEAMALYNHVGNKDDLLDGMLDRVIGEIELPEAPADGPDGPERPVGGPDWRDLTRRRAISAHTVLMRHPWAAARWTTSVSAGPARLRYLDGALRCLRIAGFPPHLLDRAFHTIEDHIAGHALQALGFPLDREEMAATGEELMRSFPADRYPDLAAHIRHHLDQPDDGGGFAFGLDLILDGLERLRGPD